MIDFRNSNPYPVIDTSLSYQAAMARTFALEMELISQTLPFSELLSRTSSLPDHAWIYSHADVDRFDLSTLASIYEIDSRDLTDDEADTNEIKLSELGLEVALSKQQLDEVLANAEQRGVRRPEELMRHVDYYIFHDAFLPE